MTGFNVVECVEGDRYSWNEYVRKNSHSHVYHLWEWGDLLCRTYNYDRHYWAVKKGDEIIGVFPCLFVRSLIFGQRLISLPFVEYAGPILKNKMDSATSRVVLTQLLDSTLKLSKKLRADYTEIRHPQISLASLLQPVGFEPVQRHVTFNIDLTKEESGLWAQLDKKCRNSLRKAMRSGIDVEEVDSNNLEQYYYLYLQSQKRLGSPPNSFDFFQNLYDAFKPGGYLKMTLAVYDSKPIAGVIVLCFREKLYWFGNVTNRKYVHLNPTNLLLWRMIQCGIENSFSVFDLGETRKEDIGIYHFKSGWGGNETNLEDYIFFRRRVELPNPRKRKYILLSKLWSKMPEVMARRIGPRLIGGIAL